MSCEFVAFVNDKFVKLFNVLYPLNPIDTPRKETVNWACLA